MQMQLQNLYSRITYGKKALYNIPDKNVNFVLYKELLNF